MGFPFALRLDMMLDPRSLGLWAQQIAGGDAAAFERLFDAYRDPLCRYICAFTKSWEEAEDLVSEVFLTLWRKREALGAVRDLHAYLYTTARFSALDYVRHAQVRQRWQAQQGTAAGLSDGAHSSSVEHWLVSEELTAAMVHAIDELPVRQREILRQRLEGQSYRDIAAVLGISIKTVEVHVTRAISRLRARLQSSFE